MLLDDWIRRTVQVVGVDLPVCTTTHGTEDDPSQWPAATVGTAMALCSDDYLMPALRLAYSLVDQICKAEEAGKSPTLRTDWVDNIFVYDYNNRVRCELVYGGGRRGSLDSLGFRRSFNVDSLGFDLSDVDDYDFGAQNLFESVVEDGSALSEEERGRDIAEGCDYIRAEFSPSLFSMDDDGLARDAMQRIYALGIVFYVIFSGGERPSHAPAPTELVEQKLSVRSDSVTELDLSQDLSEDFDPLPFDQVAPIDLAVNLSKFDNIDDRCAINQLNDNTVDDALQNPKPKKKHAQITHEKCSASVERLREKGLPTSLCNLVVNMMDCTNGTLSGEDSYQNMSDVRSDLRLMLDNPNVFLRDQDMGKLSTTGSHFMEKTMFGRKAELSRIKDAYQQSISGECGLVTISGPSGSGKSLLAAEFGRYVCAGGGIFLSGKFDLLKQGKPFSALASAFDKYCGILLNDDKLASTKEEVARQLRSVLGMETYHLTKIIPNLATILGSELSVLEHSEDCINAQKRVQYLLCQFVEVISISSLAPITLFLDDLQWADAVSIAAVNQLLFAAGPSAHKNFFFLGCSRERDSTTKLLPGVEFLIVGGINVKLGCMDEYTLNTMISETLCLSPRLTRTFSSLIYVKTKGNPLFVSRLLRSLNKEGLLRPSLSQRRWEWDERKIRSRSLPEDVAIFLTESLGELPQKVQSALFVLSCFGASSESAFVECQGLDRDILENLDIAVAEGFVDKKDDQYRFAHDRIQEAAYNTISPLKRCLVHFNYGLELSSLLIEDEGANDSVLFTAVNQLNLGGPPAVQVHSQYLTAAKLNLRAGKKAMGMSDYEIAYSYFDSGISFLRKKHWQEHYTLSLELFGLAAKCALTKGDHVSLKHLTDEVVTKAHFFEDKLEVLYFDMCALAYSSRLTESIETGLGILSKLGIEVKGTNINACVQETKDLLSGHTDDEILNSKQMTHPTMIMAMKFLGKLEMGMTQVMPKSVPYVTQRIIQLSLSHGLSPVSPIGFVHFGSYIAKLGDISGGYHYVKLARSLLDKVGSRESAGEVICFGTQVVVYVEPLQAAVEHNSDGYAAAMAFGDVSQAAANKLLYCSNCFFAGTKLLTLRDKYAELIKFLEERKQVIFMIQSQCQQYSVYKLVGTDEEPKHVSAEEQNILATNNSVMSTYYYQRAYISFMFRSYDDTKANIEKYLACVSHTWANLLLAHAYHAFHTGLISFWVARKSRDDQQWHQRGKESKLALKKWAESSQWTFENKWYLLEAEESFCNNDFEAAKTYYDKAIASAKRHKFVHEEALACELAAYFWLELGYREQTVEYFMLAHEKYLEWGALGKCKSLLEFVEFTKKLWLEGGIA